MHPQNPGSNSYVSSALTSGRKLRPPVQMAIHVIISIWSELHVRNPSTIRVVNHNMMTSSMNAAWCGWWLDG
jgi:hypothetical protein